MWKIFQRWRWVCEVFSFKRLNRWDNWYEFVRFCDVKNIRNLEMELDAIFIDAMKLYVNLSSYKRGEVVRKHMPTTVKPKSI